VATGMITQAILAAAEINLGKTSAIETIEAVVANKVAAEIIGIITIATNQVEVREETVATTIEISKNDIDTQKPFYLKTLIFQGFLLPLFGGFNNKIRN